MEKREHFEHFHLHHRSKPCHKPTRSYLQMSSVFLDAPFTVNSPNTTVNDEEIQSTYVYNTVEVDGTTVTPKSETYEFKTAKKVPKTGMLLVGWGGNNGCTVIDFTI